MHTELPEVATPEQPKEWKQINSDHHRLRPWRRDHAACRRQWPARADEWRQAHRTDLLAAHAKQQATAIEKQVFKPRTSAEMRYLFRLNVEKGSGRQARRCRATIVGGKTGTAEKVVNGRYSHNKRFDAFLAGFPIDDPQYIVLVIIDEPKARWRLAGDGGLNCAPTVGNIIRRIGTAARGKARIRPRKWGLARIVIDDSVMVAGDGLDDWNAMKLREFSDILPVDGDRAGDIEISGLGSDTRTLERGNLFFALAGSKADGAAYAARLRRVAPPRSWRAVARHSARYRLPVIEVVDPRRALALSAARFFGAQPATMAAVTGTSGKTSVAAFTRQIWAHAGKAAASIGTTGVTAPGREDYGSLTTPDPVALHKLLKELAEAGVTHAAMEASSHGLDQRRLDGVRLAAGAFTNLGRDHMDYHATVEDYHRAKMRLFESLLPKGAPAVIFADDAWSRGDRGRGTRAPVSMCAPSAAKAHI